MVKKGLVVLVLAVLVAGGAFAQAGFKLSAGAGGYFTSDFGGGYETSTRFSTSTSEFPYAGGGGFLFLDATFAELSFGFWGGSGKSETTGGIFNGKVNISYTGLDIGLLGKYPFTISNQLSLFPLFGITFRVILSGKSGNVKLDDPEDFSALWFRLGGGLDYSFTNSIYLRAGILYGLRLPNKAENDAVERAENSIISTDANTLLGHGLEIKVAVGFRF
jgi:opacity protein-like surface antigen